MTLLEFNNVSKIYKNQIKALNNISFSVNNGMIALIGPNGAGKTTLFKLVMGFIRPTSGEIKVFSLNSWENASQTHEKVSFFFERQNFPANLTINQYLDYVKCFYDNFEYESYLKMFKLKKEQKIGTLSGGMLKKLGVVQALGGMPSLILMDEPTANLDPVARKDFLDLIRQMYLRYKITFIISSHNLADLEQIATDIIVVNKGELIYQGKFNDFREKYSYNTYELHANNLPTWKTVLENVPYIEVIESLNSFIVFRFTNQLQIPDLINQIYDQIKINHLEISVIKKRLTLESLFENT